MENTQKALDEIRCLMESAGISWFSDSVVQWSLDEPGKIPTCVGPFEWGKVISAATSEFPDLADLLLIFLREKAPVIEPRAVFHHLMIIAAGETDRADGQFIAIRRRNPNEWLFAIKTSEIEKPVLVAHG
jgi:hypothetical protein